MVDIRAMTAPDLAQVAALERQCFSTPWSPKVFEEELENELALYFVAAEGAVICGYIGFWKIVDEGHITNVAVLEQYRGRGIGGRLIAQAIDTARAAGLKLLTLEVRRSNAPAIALYKKYGFVELGFRKRYYHDPEEDALIMTLYLD